MKRDSESESKGWWQTLPGLLTATAAIITALTGLLVAAHQAGFLSRELQPTAHPQVVSSPIPGGSRPVEADRVPLSSSSSGATSRTLALPAITEVRSGDDVFKLLSVKLQPYSPDKVSVRLTVRMANNGRYPANFWSSSFCLLVEGSLQAPINDLDDIVAAHSSREGEVEFVIPARISTVGLQMGDAGNGKPAIPLDLQNAVQ